MIDFSLPARARLAVGALAVVGLLALSGCSAGMSSSDSVAPASAPEYAMQDRSLVAGEAGVDRSIITTGWATIVVDDPQVAAAEAAAIATRVGGRVESSSTSAPNEYNGGSASVTLRVPAASLPKVLAELEALGTPQQSSTNSTDVTMEVTDLEARIGALESAIERLTELLAAADTTEALIQIETAMTDRQAELDSLRAQQRYLSDQVAMSTLTVDFQTKPTVPKAGPDDFLGGIVAGWEALIAFGGGLLVFAGVLLPWLLPLGVIALIIWLIVRASRRRAAAAPVPPPPAPPAPPVVPAAPAVDAPAPPQPMTDKGWPIVSGDGKDA